MLRYVNIKKLNIYSISQGYTSTSTSYTKNQFFGEAYIDSVSIKETITSIPQYAFKDSYIYELEIPDNVVSIGKYAFYVKNTTGFNVTRMSNSITTLDSYCFYYPIFKTDVDFSNLTFSTSSHIYNATYEGKIDFSKNEVGGSTFAVNQCMYYAIRINELWLPSRVLAYRNSDTVVKEKVYIKDFQNYINSTFSSAYPLGGAKELYVKSLNSDSYIKLVDFNLGDWLITELNYSGCFSYCKAFNNLDATSLTIHKYGIFNGNSITSLKIDSKNGQGEISASYNGCASLTSIIDTSNTPWKSIATDAFTGINENVSIQSDVFGLYKQSSGFTLSPMESGVVSALAFGDYTFTAPSGAAFGDGTTSKTLALGYTGVIEDLTERLKIEYLTLVISSNLNGAQFKLTYTSSDGTAKEDVVSAGTHLLKVTKGTSVKVEANETPKGWTATAATNVTMSSTSNSVTMDFTEEANVYIADISGNLYTEAEWTASGKSNDQAEGVCVMRAKSGGFVIAKENAGQDTWGSSGAMPKKLDYEAATKDYDGYDNTMKMQLILTSAPAADLCTNYHFPSGDTGYLPAAGELKLAFSLNLNHLLEILGGTPYELYKSSWTSSPESNTSYAYGFYVSSETVGDPSSNSRSASLPVRAAKWCRTLTITSNIAAKFTLSYTNGYGDVVTEKVSQGSHNLNVKNGTQVTVTPDAIGNITAEPQTFTWQGFTCECNFVFAKDAGVYIQHVNGALYTESEWTAGGYANSDANGVAVLGSDVSFVISSKRMYNCLGGYGKTISGIVSTSSSSTAVLDIDGIGNTQKIIEQLDGYTDSQGVSGAPAAEACAAYTFPNGKKGYLPALGEWQIAYNNKTAVVSAMSLIGGSISIGPNLTSTEYNAGQMWTLTWSSAYISNYGKTTTLDFKPFTTV